MNTCKICKNKLISTQWAYNEDLKFLNKCEVCCKYKNFIINGDLHEESFELENYKLSFSYYKKIYSFYGVRLSVSIFQSENIANFITQKIILDINDLNESFVNTLKNIFISEDLVSLKKVIALL